MKNTKPLWEQIHMLFQDKESFTLKEAYEAIPDKPKTTIRGRIYDKLGIHFSKIDEKNAVYKAIKNDSECIIIEGDGRNLSILEDASIDCIINDHAWKDDKSNIGGSRKFTDEYPCFTYTLDDFKEKARVLKDGCFLVEILPSENENNFEYLYKIKKMAQECGLLYYAKVPWKKGTFVSNTGRKSKNTEDIMIFSKGKARSLRLDAKKTKATGIDSYMSGTNGMLPTMFDVQPVAVKDKVHQSEKPVPLYEELLEFFTLPGEHVLDQYAGAGGLGLACINKLRNCTLIEILKDNVNLIVERFKNIPNISLTKLDLQNL